MKNRYGIKAALNYAIRTAIAKCVSGKDFSRKRTLTRETVIRLIIGAEGGSLDKILHTAGIKVTVSAVTQRRVQIAPEVFRAVFTNFKRLEQANIEYGFFYLTSISGKGHGEAGAKASADVFNQLHPFLAGLNMLTIYPESDLYQEIQNGNWEEEGELEKYRELRTLVENLNISTYFAAMGASNAFQLRGKLPEEKETLLATLDRIISQVSEEDLRRYSDNLPHL